MVPNVFSPNGDGINDFLNCFLSCHFPFKLNQFQVFNRWGGLIYSTNSENLNDIHWDGAFRGKALDEGVYLWVLHYEFTRKGIVNQKTIMGDVKIIN